MLCNKICLIFDLHVWNFSFDETCSGIMLRNMGDVMTYKLAATVSHGADLYGCAYLTSPNLIVEES